MEQPKRNKQKGRVEIADGFGDGGFRTKEVEEDATKRSVTEERSGEEQADNADSERSKR